MDNRSSGRREGASTEASTSSSDTRPETVANRMPSPIFKRIVEVLPALSQMGFAGPDMGSAEENAKFKAEIAALEAAETAVSGFEAERTGLEAGSAGTEAVTEGAGFAESTEVAWRPINILTELFQDLREELKIKGFRKNLVLYKYIIWLWRKLMREAPEDPVPEHLIVIPRLQRAVKLIQELAAESEATIVMTRMVLLTAVICFEAVTEYWAPPKFGEHELNEPLIHILLSYVLRRKQNTELFKKFLKNHGRLQVDYFNSEGVSILYVAIKHNNLEMVKAIIEQGANCLKVSKENDSALHAAVGHPIIFKCLLKQLRHTPELRIYNNKGYTPIHLAIISKQLQQVELIADVNVMYLSEMVNKGMKTCLHLALDVNSVEIVKAIFVRLESTNKYETLHMYLKYMIMSQLDENGYTAFQAALQGENKDIVQLFLCNGAVLTDQRKNDKSALEIIATRFNDASNILCDAFDHSIRISTTSGENTIDYSLLTDIRETSQINVIEKIVECHQSDLLLHPLIKSYVYLKWNYFLTLFYIIISVHAIFLITFNVLVATTFYYRDTTNITLLTNQTSNGGVPWLQLYDWRYWTLITLMYVIITVLIVQESFTIYTKKDQWRRHFADRETWTRLVFLVLAIFLPVALACAEPADWQRHLACAALLLGWLQAMFLLSRFPSWGSYVHMLGRVVFNLLKILASMIFLIIGFSFCFMIQYRSTAPFNGPVAAFFKTLVMMSSEFDYEALFGEDHDKELRDTILVVRLLFGVFVVFVAIALMNFMTGAAVSDINELTVIAEKRRLEKQVQLLSTIEAIVYKEPYVKIFKILFSRGRHYKKITYSTIKVFKVRPSVKLNEAFVKIERKKEWHDEKINVNITKNKIEELHEAFLDKAEGEEKGTKDWVREAISRQEERIRSLAEDLQRVAQANEQMNCCIEDVNSKIEKLISKQTQTSDSIQQLIVEIKKMAKENQ